VNEALFQAAVSLEEHNVLDAMFDGNVEQGISIGMDDIVHAVEVPEMQLH
jgi:hypothetical protein